MTDTCFVCRSCGERCWEEVYEDCTVSLRVVINIGSGQSLLVQETEDPFIEFGNELPAYRCTSCQEWLRDADGEVVRGREALCLEVKKNGVQHED